MGKIPPLRLIRNSSSGDDQKYELATESSISPQRKSRRWRKDSSPRDESRRLSHSSDQESVKVEDVQQEAEKVDDIKKEDVSSENIKQETENDVNIELPVKTENIEEKIKVEGNI